MRCVVYIYVMCDSVWIIDVRRSKCTLYQSVHYAGNTGSAHLIWCGGHWTRIRRSANTRDVADERTPRVPHALPRWHHPSLLKKTSDEVLTGGDLYRFYTEIRNLNVNAPSLTRIVCDLPAVYSFAWWMRAGPDERPLIIIHSRAHLTHA